MNDIGTEVILAASGLRHGLDRRFGVNAPVTRKAGEILKNSIRINELTPSKAEADGSYVLIGAARNDKGELYVVRSIVNRFKSELVSMDVLYAMNAKTEPKLGIEKRNREGAYPQDSLSNDNYLTDSTISIAQLLEYVNKLPQFSTRFRLLLLLRTKKGRLSTSFFRTEKERFGLRH